MEDLFSNVFLGPTHPAVAVAVSKGVVCALLAAMICCQSWADDQLEDALSADVSQGSR